MEYIIVQAGGKGTRLGYLTKNKPKALTPVENLPMLFYLFRKYRDKRFVIIADYKKDVLHKYLDAFAYIKYVVVDANGTGTCSGVKQAIDLIPDDEPFMLIWSDLILPEDLKLPSGYEEDEETDRKQEKTNIDEKPDKDYIGISGSFECRWKYEKGGFAEERSTRHGVAGLFLFRRKQIINDVPESGELVRWMRDKGLFFEELNISGTREFGLLEDYKKLEQQKTRPFNRIRVENGILIKEPVDDQGRKLALRESAWYEKARQFGIQGIPIIYDTNPLKMEFINGKNIYECQLEYDEKRKILYSLVNTLKQLHELGNIPTDSFSMKEAYFNKTMQRLSKVRDLVPFANDEFIYINGRKCKNVFYYRESLEKALDKLQCDKFVFIHGDCTFSNMMIRTNGEPVLIDPRGYFGFTENYGDERYDWAKLYYSIVGNYDRFNLKEFTLDIGGHSIINGNVIGDLSDKEVMLTIRSNGWEDMEKDFFKITGVDSYEIKLLHAVIWLSLTTYAWQDYDSICGAFYNGLYYLEEVL